MSNFFNQLPKIDLKTQSVREVKQKLNYAYGILQSALKTYEGISSDVQRDVRSVQYCINEGLTAIMAYLDAGYEIYAPASNVPTLALCVQRAEKARKAASARQDKYDALSKQLGEKERKVGYEYVPEVTFSSMRGVTDEKGKGVSLGHKLLGGAIAAVAIIWVAKDVFLPPMFPDYATKGKFRPTER